MKGWFLRAMQEADDCHARQQEHVEADLVAVATRLAELGVIGVRILSHTRRTALVEYTCGGGDGDHAPHLAHDLVDLETGARFPAGSGHPEGES